MVHPLPVINSVPPAAVLRSPSRRLMYQDLLGLTLPWSSKAPRVREGKSGESKVVVGSQGSTKGFLGTRYLSQHPTKHPGKQPLGSQHPNQQGKGKVE